VRTLLLLTATLGVWLAEYVNRRQTEQLQLKIQRLMPIARELVVRDATDLVIIRVEPLHKDDYQWDVHVPGDGFRLAIATRDVNTNRYGEYPSAADTVALPAGRCRIVLDHLENERGLKVNVFLNKVPVFALFQAYSEPMQSAECLTGNHRDSSHENPRQRCPLLQYRRKDNEPGLGLSLWIEPPPKSAREDPE
jgi:hypothetical protein